MKKVVLATLVALGVITNVSLAEDTCQLYAKLMALAYQLGVQGRDCKVVAFQKKAKNSSDAYIQRLIYHACLEGRLDALSGEAKEEKIVKSYYFNECILKLGY